MKLLKFDEVKLNSIVYHVDVYNYKEPLRVVGIREDQLELEGNYSEGVNNIRKKQWLPISGVSTIENYAYLQEARNAADSAFNNISSIIGESNKPIRDNKIRKTIINLVKHIHSLTNKIKYNFPID